MDLSQPPPGGADHPFPSERRTSSRYPYQRKALCRPCFLVPSLSPKEGGKQEDDVWLMGISQDLSAVGIGFLLHRRFDPGTLLTIELQRPQLDSWGLLPARVMHVMPQADGNWKLGCALIQAMSEEELRRWIDGQERMAAALR
jgi:PilZ domain